MFCTFYFLDKNTIIFTGDGFPSCWRFRCRSGAKLIALLVAFIIVVSIIPTRFVVVPWVWIVLHLNLKYFFPRNHKHFQKNHTLLLVVTTSGRISIFCWLNGIGFSCCWSGTSLPLALALAFSSLGLKQQHPQRQAMMTIMIKMRISAQGTTMAMMAPVLSFYMEK